MVTTSGFGPEKVYNHIGGKDVPALSRETYIVKNPLTGEPLYEAAGSSIADAEAAIEAAEAGFKVWSAMGPSRRRTLLNNVADIIESWREDIGRALSLEVSATPDWSVINVNAAAGLFREAAALATHIKGEIVPADRPGTTIMVTREPAGVVFSISPWNSPVNLTARAVATPLICGNSVILKPSEYSPRTQRFVAEAIQAAGIPDGVINYLSVAPKDAPQMCEFLIQHKSIRRINFTGSDKVGRAIATAAAKVLKPVLLELGGKAPVIVLESTDQNLEDAVNAVIYGAFMNTGQICMSTERVVVQESVAERFVAMLKTKVSKLRFGNHLNDPSVHLSGLINAASATRCVKVCQEAVDAGAHLVMGDLKTDGTVMQPHILDRVTRDMRAYVEESFGPILAVSRVADDAEAVAVANDTEYSLTSAVYCADIMRALKVAKRLKYGSAHINGPTLYVEAPLPNGGVGGGSGYGRFGGINGIHEFTDQKIITLSEPGPKFSLVQN